MDRKLSQAEVDRITSAHQSKRAAFETIKQDYASMNQAVNKKRHEHYFKELPSVLAKYEQVEKHRIERTAQYIRASADAEQSVMHILGVCHAYMMKAADSVSTEKELELLAANLRTESSPPGDEDFLELDADRGLTNGGSGGGSNQSLTGGGKPSAGTISRNNKKGLFGWRNSPDKVSGTH